LHAGLKADAPAPPGALAAKPAALARSRRDSRLFEWSVVSGQSARRRTAIKITLSVIKADIGSIGGHIAPWRKLPDTVRGSVRDRSQGRLLDSYISHTGDDIALVMTHPRGVGRRDVHQLARDVFSEGT
jgi:hypothetical protein